MENIITFEEFEQKYLGEVLNKKPDNIRKGQALMNFLHDIWPEEYRRLSSIDYYDNKDIDCFYRDRLIPNTLKHLREVWKNYPN